MNRNITVWSAFGSGKFFNGETEIELIVNLKTAKTLDIAKRDARLIERTRLRGI